MTFEQYLLENLQKFKVLSQKPKDELTQEEIEYLEKFSMFSDEGE